MSVEAPASVAATTAPIVACPEVDMLDQRVSSVAVATVTPTAVAAAAEEEVATVLAEAAETTESTASPLRVPHNEPNSISTGTLGTMLPIAAIPKMPPKPTIHART